MSQPTALELDARVRYLLSEGGRQFFTPEAIRSFLNDAQDFLVAEDLYLSRGGFEFWSVPYQSSYLLREEMIAPEQLYVRMSTGQSYRIEFEKQDDVDERTRLGRTPNASTTVTAVTYARGVHGIEMEITPALSIRTKLTYRGATRMKPLVNDTDRTECPPSLVHILIHFTVWQCKKKDEEVRQAQDWERQVQRDTLELKAQRMRSTASDKNATVTLRPKRRFFR